MNQAPEFTPFQKLARLHREAIVTEKIDGTNAQIMISEVAHSDYPHDKAVAVIGRFAIHAGSRNRWITPDDDNFGFAKWVTGNAEELVKLGPGRHFGEWWGSGIQRGYGLSEKRFSLFNTIRWVEDLGNGCRGPLGVIGQPDPRSEPKYQQYAPPCCRVVPVLYRGPFDGYQPYEAADKLRETGSVASPGFMKPEGIVMFHVAANTAFKYTFDGDGHKGGDRRKHDTPPA